MENFGFRRGSSVAIDLGNSNTILAGKKNTASSHPSFVVFDDGSQNVVAVGNDAFEMLGKAPQRLKVVKPLKGGVIADFNSASKMLNALIKHVYPKRTFFSSFDCIISGVPFSTTEVERRALRDTLEQFNSSKTYLLFEPLAAAIGIGLDIEQPEGQFLVDIGGGITEAVVISFSGIVNYHSIKTAGDSFDDDIQKYFKKNFNLDLGLNMAEKVKIAVGAAQELQEDIPEPLHVIGKDSVTGVPKGVTVDHLEIAYVLNNSILKIEQAILRTLEECPPELAGDIYQNGIHLTGGSSLLRGLKRRLEAKVKIPVLQDPNALYSVSKGISIVLSDIDKYKPVLFK